ncbi:MAG TPA: cellulase family glycosylhydrolase [Polyangiaceae bacterium]|nr:cellulase family glycosylhydrolase [Polyangiaceae bacterium]
MTSKRMPRSWLTRAVLGTTYVSRLALATAPNVPIHRPDYDPPAAVPAPAAATAPVAAALSAGTRVARPSYNTGTGFFVVGDQVYDANGNPFRIRGVNTSHFWGGDTRPSIPSLATAGVNTARAVFGPGPGTGAPTPDAREAIVRQYIAQGIVPMVDYHNATCQEDPALVDAAVDFWTGPDRAWLTSLDRYVMLNITNEWGPNSAVWGETYKRAVVRLRAAGIKNLLVIDAGGACGQNAESVENFAREVVDADPEKNVVFSVHMYGFWQDAGSPKAGTWDGRQPYDMDQELTRLKATGAPIIVGEFSWQGFSDVTYGTRAALASYEKHGIGWLAWMWHNPGGDGRVNIVNGSTYGSSADLTEFGRLVVEDPELGLRANARKATIFE